MNTEKQLEVAIIGCGAIAYSNAEAIRAAKNARLAYAVDVNPESAAGFGDKYNVPYASEIEEALGDKKVDAIFICTPHFQHAPIAEAAARAGKQVIVEKPMGANLKESRRIVAVCRQAGVKLGVCYCMRYSEKIEFVKKFIETGGLGDPVGFQIAMIRDKSENYLKRNTWEEVNPDWHGVKAKAGGGIFINNISHYLDYYLYAAGLRVKEVSGRSHYGDLPMDVEEYISVTLNCEKGAIGTVMTGNNVPGGGTEQSSRNANTLQRLWGSDGQVILLPRLRVFSRRRALGFEPNRWHTIRPSRRYNTPGTGLRERRRFVERFAAAVLEERLPDISGEDGLRVMEIIDAAYASAQTGRPVSIGPLTHGEEDKSSKQPSPPLGERDTG